MFSRGAFSFFSILCFSFYYFIGLSKGQLSFPDCGKFAEPSHTPPSGDPRSPLGSSKKDIPHIPWSALIELKLNHSATESCAGVLIGPQHILSSAQCFCHSPDRPCDDFRRRNGSERMLRPLYDFKSHAVVYLGLKEVHEESPSHPIEDVLIHPQFKSKHENDIALIQLRDKVELSSELNPICLPFGPGFPDTASRGYVTGWGSQAAPCSTDEFGPSAVLPCQFPFTYKGQSFSRCLLTQPPSNEVCLAYEKRILKGFKVSRSEVAEILHNNETLTRCYSADEGSMGWCGTCSSQEEEEDCKATPVMGDANWGWCSKSTCSEKSSESPHKYFTQGYELNIFNSEKCTSLIASSSSTLSKPFESSAQLCAGGSLSSKVTRKKLFELLEHIGDDGQASAVFVQKASQLQNDVFQGASCNGAVGAPLWRWMGIHEKRAFVVGVATTTGCSTRSPSIFTRTRKFLPWILRNMKAALKEDEDERERLLVAQKKAK